MLVPQVLIDFRSSDDRDDVSAFDLVDHPPTRAGGRPANKETSPGNEGARPPTAAGRDNRDETPPTPITIFRTPNPLIDRAANFHHAAELPTHRRIIANTILGFQYTKADVLRRPRNCFVGFLAVFLVVFFTGLVLAAVSKTNYLFLRFAELQAGEMDGIVYATNGVPVVNFTSFAEKVRLNASETISGMSPRWIAKGRMLPWAQLLKRQQQASSTSIVNQSGVPYLPMNILVVDSKREKQEGIGRGWTYRPIGYGEAQVTGSALEFIDVQPNVGERMSIVVDLQELLTQQSVNIPTTASFGDQNINVTDAQLRALEALNALNLTSIDFTVVKNIPGIPPVPNISQINSSTVVNGGSTEIRINGASFDVAQYLTPQLSFNVADGITSSEGKYPSALGNVILLDYEWFIQLISDQSCATGSTVFTADGGSTPTIPSPLELIGFSSVIDGVDLADYALMIVVMFRNRYTMYYKDSRDIIKDMVQNSNQLMRAVGYLYPGQVSYPTAEIVVAFSTFNNLLTSVFAAVVIVILVLSVILVLTLLQTNGEERQFELAIIRSLGMTKEQLLYIMTTEVMAFALPGVACGFGLLLVSNAVFERILSDFALTPYDPFRLPLGSTVFAVVAGLLMPFVANWTPLTEAMTQSLRDALDVNRQKWNETKVSMIKLAELGLESWQLMFGVFLVVAGFMVYYLLPMSFLYSNLSMFFIIMDVILLTMMFGLCLLVYAFQGVVGEWVLWALLWGKDKRLQTLILKNMEAHRDRNSKAFMMFVICIACVVFGGVAFDMLTATMGDLVELASGADLYVTSNSFAVPLNKSNLDVYLAAHLGATVTSWSYSTFGLSQYPQVNGGTKLKNVLGTGQSVPIIGLTETFIDTVFEKYVVVSETAAGYGFTRSPISGALDVVRSLYQSPNATLNSHPSEVYSGYPPNLTAPDATAKMASAIPVLVATAAEKVLGLDTSGVAALDYTYMLAGGVRQSTNFLVQPRALLSRLPGFPGISPQIFGFAAGAVLVSVDSFGKLILANDTDFAGQGSPSTALASGYVPDVRYRNLYIRLRPGLSDHDRTFFLNSLQSQLDSYFSTSLDVAVVLQSVRKVSNLMMAFFYFSEAICVLLSSFMTWLVFVSNVTQNAWSFGVLRSLGFTKVQVLRSVIYEAVTLVISSFLLGMPIGLFVGFTLGNQMNTFLNLPFDFSIPYAVLIVLVGMASVAAVGGSWLPMRTLNAMNIAKVIKKYN